MIARKALTNPSIFRKSGILASVEEEVKSFLKLVCFSFIRTVYFWQKVSLSQVKLSVQNQVHLLNYRR